MYLHTSATRSSFIFSYRPWQFMARDLSLSGREPDKIMLVQKRVMFGLAKLARLRFPLPVFLDAPLDPTLLKSLLKQNIVSLLLSGSVIGQSVLLAAFLELCFVADSSGCRRRSGRCCCRSRCRCCCCARSRANKRNPVPQCVIVLASPYWRDARKV